MTGHDKAEKLRNAAQQKAYAAAKPANATPSRTHVNSRMTGLYTGSKMGCTRPGAGQLVNLAK